MLPAFAFVAGKGGLSPRLAWRPVVDFGYWLPLQLLLTMTTHLQTTTDGKTTRVTLSTTLISHLPKDNGPSYI